ncbi:apolipo D [Brachionus plicatilis]|uniref:Apolipoprotein D n=1 Tax=Brachionus plicatilis TaxID=10195 RepID=A0A3M7T490_BRAPC|nr:apolipo D [Brachionus plicatilis]
MNILFMLSIISVALVSNTNARVWFGTRCPNTPVIPDFDLSRYAGKWYEIESIFSQEYKCGFAEYAVQENNRISVRNTGTYRNSGEIRIISGEGYVPNPNEPNKLIVSLSVNGLFNFNSEGNYHILKSDYDNYALVYSCKIYLGFIKFDATWLLSRTQSLSEENTAELKKLLSDNGIDTRGFYKPDQSCNN